MLVLVFSVKLLWLTIWVIYCGIILYRNKVLQQCLCKGHRAYYFAAISILSVKNLDLL